MPDSGCEGLVSLAPFSLRLSYVALPAAFVLH